MKRPPAPAPVVRQSGRGWIGLAAAGLIFATLLAYLPSFRGVLVYDDEPAISLNPTLRQLGTALFPPADTSVSGRPVANLTLALNHALSGTQVGSYHLVNWLIHALACVTLFGLVRQTLLRPPVPPAPATGATPADPTLLAFTIALLWGLHPLQTESVTYIVQRVESLMGLFFLLTFYGFVRSIDSPHPARWRALSIGACLLGVGTKEVMATAPLLVFLYDRTFVAGSFRRAWAERRRFHLALVATWLPLAALVASTGWTRGGTAGFGVGVPPGAYWLTQFEAVVTYLRLALWPHPLVFDRSPFWVQQPLTVLPYAIVVVVLGAATGWALRRRPAAGYLGAWFFVLLAPTSLMPGTLQMIVEHRMYLPLAAVVTALALGLHTWLGRRGLAAALVLAAAFGWLTAQRNLVYQSPRTLWSDTLAHCPDNDRAHNNLGNLFAMDGEYEAAIDHLQTALRLHPDNPESRANLGHALRRCGRLPEAISHYEEALRLNPRMPDTLAALGIALDEIGQQEAAISRYEQALRLRSDHTDALNRLGIALAQRGQITAAIGHFEHVLRVAPAQVETHNNLGHALQMAGRPIEAQVHYETALRLQPDFLPARLSLAKLLLETDRLPEATAHYERILQAVPGHPEAHNNLATLLLMSGRSREAIAHFEQVLQFDPNLAQVHQNLAIALDSVGRTQEAAAHYEAARRLGLATPPRQ